MSNAYRLQIVRSRIATTLKALGNIRFFGAYQPSEVSRENGQWLAARLNTPTQPA